ncbi:MAG: hypothetical protein LBQ15_02675 [Clostridium sp.]|nr:hypothetical protein [Clostridium sp.]
MESVITTKNLIKTFGGQEVIKSCNISVRQGEIYGFLGLNGTLGVELMARQVHKLYRRFTSANSTTGSLPYGVLRDRMSFVGVI